MFKVGDRVYRRDVRRPSPGPYTVTEICEDGWFNHDGPTIDYSPDGGCCESFWRVLPPQRVSEVTSRANDPATSKGKRRISKYEECVVSLLSHNPKGLVGIEMASISGFPLNCITPRFAPLRRKGLIKAKTNPIPAFADQVIKRDKQIVWVLA